MTQQFVKLNRWMTNMGLRPTEMIIFAVICSFSANGGSYYGGNAGLIKWTGCSERTVVTAVKHLVRAGWIYVAEPAKGQRPASLRVSVEKLAELRREDAAPAAESSPPVTQSKRRRRRDNRQLKLLTAEEMLARCGSGFYD